MKYYDWGAMEPKDKATTFNVSLLKLGSSIVTDFVALGDLLDTLTSREEVEDAAINYLIIKDSKGRQA